MKWRLGDCFETRFWGTTPPGTQRWWIRSWDRPRYNKSWLGLGMWLGNNAQRALQRYLFRFRPKPINPVTNNVFLSTRSQPLTENSMKLMFTRLAKRSGVCRLHAHLCRHTFATRFLINGGDVFSLQQILGHSTLEMVRHYVNLASSHIAIQHQKFSPLDRLNLRG